MRIFISILLGIAALTIAVIIAFKISPWPSVLLIRYAFTTGAANANNALEKHVPQGISSILNEHYDKNDPDAFLDVYFPSKIEATDDTLTAVVWVHGGGWISGSKEETCNYYKILASKGYTVIAIDYSIAPEKKYPTPLRQTNAALGYLSENSKRLHVNASKFVLAGDSGGSSIVAQVANIISVPSYSRLLEIKPTITRSHLSGLLLYCGPYNLRAANLNGEFGTALKSFLWSYSGGTDFMTNSKFATITLVDYVTSDFPPAFISAGNADPLLGHSLELAEILGNFGVKIDTLFFPSDHIPAQPHEYQFNLDSDEGQLALHRSVKFLSGLKPVTNHIIE